MKVKECFPLKTEDAGLSRIECFTVWNSRPEADKARLDQWAGSFTRGLPKATADLAFRLYLKKNHISKYQSVCLACVCEQPHP